MKRRDFLVRTSGAVSVPFLLNGIPLKAFDGPVHHRLFGGDMETDRVLVLIQLNGGNDGLNTIIPLDQEERYQSLRPGVAIPLAKAVKLTDVAGLHPAMTGVKTLWDERKVGIVQGVTYPNPNLSHFRSTDIWMSASDADKNLASGWLGRYLGTVFPDYPTGYPNAVTPDPIAIQMTATVGLTLSGPKQQAMGIALQDPESFYRLIAGTELSFDDLPNTDFARNNVMYVRDIQSQSMEYSQVIKAAADKAVNKVEYPAAQPNRLSGQLQVVARLIAGGLKTRVYVVQLGGFDTHASQVVDGEPEVGGHASLLTFVSEAVTAFQRDLEANGVADRVIAMTFSEFGRRPMSNESLGTDHGTAAPMLFFGNAAQDGITGVSPDLTNLDRDNLHMQFDFRQIYASVLEQWFGVDRQTIGNILMDDFQTVRVIKDSSTDVSDTIIKDTFTFAPIAPNPVKTAATLRYELTTTSSVRLQIFDSLGFHVRTLIHEEQTAGTYSIPFDTSELPSGTYAVQVTVGAQKAVQMFVITR